MDTLKLVNILYYLGSDAKELERNSFSTIEEAILEAERVSEKLKHPIPVLILVNGVSVRYATVTPDGSINYDSNIFSDGGNTINTIIATVDNLPSNVATVLVRTLHDLSCDCEYVSALLVEQDYLELLGDDFISDVRSKSGNNSDAVFKTIARMDSIIDTHTFPLSDIDVVDVDSLMKSYDYTIRDNIEKSKEYGLVSLYKSLGIYFNKPLQV